MLVVERAVEIRVLSRQGKSIREIARMFQVSRKAQLRPVVVAAGSADLVRYRPGRQMQAHFATIRVRANGGMKRFRRCAT